MTTAKQTGASGFWARCGLGFTRWAERWYPDAFVFAALGVLIVAAAALVHGAPVRDVVHAFGDGWWSLINFTMQMAMVAIGGYVVATAPPVARLIRRLAAIPASGPSAVAFIAAAAILSSFFSWGFSLVFAAQLARALARRRELSLDYRAAGAAAYLGLGATWALGLSSSAAQLQANAASMPKPVLAITGVIPFAETIFTWQSLFVFVALLIVSVLLAWWSVPRGDAVQTAEALGITIEEDATATAAPAQPGEKLEHSPVITVLLVLLTAAFVVQEIEAKGAVVAISSLNTYNLLFLMLGLLLHWRPRAFLDAVARAVPATAGVLIQFPLYGAIAAILTTAKAADGHSLADLLAEAFVHLSDGGTFPVLMGAYSALLGLFVPSGGGKWIVEAPYVMQAAIDLKVHLGWAVQVYNAAEALPNLVNPFWMLPLLGILGLKARDIVGFTFLQLLVHLPLVLLLLWWLAPTLAYHPPVIP